MKSFPVSRALGEIIEEAGYWKKNGRVVELVPLTDNVLACINGTQSLDLSDCVGNLKKWFCTSSNSKEQI